MKSGVYKIINIINNRVYVGMSNDIERRIKWHKSRLKYKNHNNPILQRAYDKYGEKNFIFEVIEYCSQEKLFEREHYWCTFLNSNNKKFGYNIAITNIEGNSSMCKESREQGIKVRKSKYESWHSEETKKKISQAKIGKKMSDEARANMSKNAPHKKLSKEHIKILSNIRSKTIYQYDLESGVLIKEWNKVRDAAIILNICEDALSQAARKNRMSDGYLWSYSKLEKLEYKTKLDKPIILINRENSILEFKNIKKTREYLNVPISYNISNSIKYGWRVKGYKVYYKKINHV